MRKRMWRKGANKGFHSQSQPRRRGRDGEAWPSKQLVILGSRVSIIIIIVVVVVLLILLLILLILTEDAQVAC